MKNNQDLSKGIQTECGLLKAIYYDDKIAEGIQISLNDEIVAMVDIMKENKVLNIPAHSKTIVYKDGSDDPTAIIYYKVKEI